MLQFHEMLKGRRELKGFTKQQMAGELGVSVEELEALESGEKKPETAQRLRACCLLDIPMLAEGEGEKIDRDEEEYEEDYYY